MERASFADYINMKDHELETLREKIIKMTAEELKNHRQQNRTQIKTGEVEMLLRAVYGIATSGRFWGKTLRKTLESMGLTRSKIDNSLYVKKNTEKFEPKNGKWLIVCTITDDIPFNGDEESKNWFVEQMRSRFRITHESTFTGLIGIEANWDDERKTLDLTQRALINKISEKFQQHISDEKRRFTPLPEDLDKTEPTEITDEEWEEAKFFDFPGFVCSLGYVAEWSKPELLYARSYLSSYLRRWDMKRVNYAIHSLMYMIHHKNYGTICASRTFRWVGVPNGIRSAFVVAS